MAAFTVIDHTEIGLGGAASWSVSSIPSSYDHLLIKASAKLNRTAYTQYGSLRFNNDSATNYSFTSLQTPSTTLLSYSYTSQDDLNVWFSTDGAASGTFGSASIWVPNYANTSNYKQSLIDCAAERNSTTASDWRLWMSAGLWQSTSAINRVDLVGGTYDFVQYSTFTLYGVTGA